MRTALLGLVFFWSGFAFAQPADFPRPAGMEADIAFWTRVYTEVDTSSGFLHDSRDLGVVYEVVQFKNGQSQRSRNRQVQSLKDQYQKILNTLASGKRQNLTAEQQRVLDLWPADVSNSRLKTAASTLRFQLGQSNKFREGYERSGLWLEYIQVRFALHGLPEELVLLPHVESSFYPSAYSKVGASGMWQFTSSTGRRFMRIDHVVDERMDPFMSTDAAAQLLEYNYSMLGSWPLALTAYNHGVAGMRRAVKQVGTDDPETIFRQYQSRSFGFASRNFYLAFLAAVDVDRNAESYFGPIKRRTPQPTTLVVTDDYIPASVIAETYGVSIDELKSHNPSLRATVWTGSKHIPKGFAVRLPGQPDQIDAVAMLAAIDTSMRFDRQKPDVTHQIQRGETLSQIASVYGVRVSELVQINGLRSQHLIRAGQVLRLPVAGDAAQAVQVAQVEAEPTPAPAAAAPVETAEATVVVAESVSVGDDAAETVVIAVADPGDDAEPVETSVAVVTTSDSGQVVGSAEGEAAGALGATLLAFGGELLESGAELVALNQVPAGEPPSGEIVLNDPDTNAFDTSPAEMSADPSDYTIAEDGTLEVQALETLGHYGDWLEIKTQRLRDLNGLRFGNPVIVGQRLKMDFGTVDRETFEQRRVAYHREIQEAFFRQYRISAAQIHTVQRGESVWILTHGQYEVPLWLLRQYNPDLDINRLRPGTVIQIPLLEQIEGLVTGSSMSASSGDTKKTATAPR